MNIQTFIFNWRGQYEKTIEKETQLKALGKSPIVINSDDAYNNVAGWHHIGDDCYFGEQFAKAVELFTGDVLFHVQADASYDNWEQLYEDAEKHFEKTDWGIYAPNVDYTWYDSSRTDITSLEFPIPGLKILSPRQGVSGAHLLHLLVCRRRTSLLFQIGVRE